MERPVQATARALVRAFKALRPWWIVGRAGEPTVCPNFLDRAATWRYRSTQKPDLDNLGAPAAVGGPGDPVLFDPDNDVPTPLDADKFRADLVRAMRRAGIALEDCPAN